MGDSCETSSGDNITSQVCHVYESISGTSQEHPVASEAAQQPVVEVVQPDAGMENIFYDLGKNPYLTNEKLSHLKIQSYELNTHLFCMNNGKYQCLVLKVPCMI